MSPGQHEARVRVALDHPALPGHFPGMPVAPGVVILDQVLQAAETWQGRALQVTALPAVKFHAPLIPEREARVLLSLEGARLRFRVEHADGLIAQGTFELNAGSGA